MILVVLKYLGLCTAAASSVWGMMNDLTIKGEDGRKRLTRPGMISILFLITGLIISITFEDLGRRKAARDQNAKVEAEAKRTNEIIIAGQPLTSLSFTLRFESGDRAFLEQMQAGDAEVSENDRRSQGGITPVPRESVIMEGNIVPMLNFLAEFGTKSEQYPRNESDNEIKKNGIVAMIPLDDSYNAILSFGKFNLRNESSGGDIPTESQNAGSLAGKYVNRANSAPYTKKETSTTGWSKYSLIWDLDPITLENAVERMNPNMRPTAKLPQNFKLMLVHHIENNSFSTVHVEVIDRDTLWTYSPEKKLKNKRENVPPITLDVSVNGFADLVHHYKLHSVEAVTLYNKVYNDNIDAGCALLTFRLD